MIVTAFSVPDSHIGYVLANDLLTKFQDCGLFPIAIPAGRKIGITDEFKQNHPDDAILAEAANILILRESNR